MLEFFEKMFLGMLSFKSMVKKFFGQKLIMKNRSDVDVIKQEFSPGAGYGGTRASIEVANDVENEELIK